LKTALAKKDKHPATAGHNNRRFGSIRPVSSGRRVSRNSVRGIDKVVEK